MIGSDSGVEVGGEDGPRSDGGALLNQTFTPRLLGDEEGMEKLVQLIRAYFRMDGHHIQFNVVDAATPPPYIQRCCAFSANKKKARVYTPGLSPS